MADQHDLYIYQDDQGHTFQMTEADARDSGYTRVGGQTATAGDQDRAAASENAPSPAAPEADADTKARAEPANKARGAAENK